MKGRYFDDEEDKLFYSQKIPLSPRNSKKRRVFTRIIEDGNYKYNCYLCQVPNIHGKGALKAHIEETNHHSRMKSEYMSDIKTSRDFLATKSKSLLF